MAHCAVGVTVVAEWFTAFSPLPGSSVSQSYDPAVMALNGVVQIQAINGNVSKTLDVDPSWNLTSLQTLAQQGWTTLPSSNSYKVQRKLYAPWLSVSIWLPPTHTLCLGVLSTGSVPLMPPGVVVPSRIALVLPRRASNDTSDTVVLIALLLRQCVVCPWHQAVAGEPNGIVMSNRVFLVHSSSLTSPCSSPTAFPNGVLVIGSGTNYSFVNQAVCNYSAPPQAPTVVRSLAVRQGPTCANAALEASTCVTTARNSYSSSSSNGTSTTNSNNNNNNPAAACCDSRHVHSGVPVPPSPRGCCRTLCVPCMRASLAKAMSSCHVCNLTAPAVSCPWGVCLCRCQVHQPGRRVWRHRGRCTGYQGRRHELGLWPQLFPGGLRTRSAATVPRYGSRGRSLPGVGVVRPSARRFPCAVRRNLDGCFWCGCRCGACFCASDLCWSRHVSTVTVAATPASNVSACRSATDVLLTCLRNEVSIGGLFSTKACCSSFMDVNTKCQGFSFEYAVVRRVSLPSLPLVHRAWPGFFGELC